MGLTQVRNRPASSWMRSTSSSGTARDRNGARTVCRWSIAARQGGVLLGGGTATGHPHVARWSGAAPSGSKVTSAACPARRQGDDGELDGDTAADDLLATGRVEHRQRPLGVEEDIEPVTGGAEPPGLRVVDRRRPRRRRHDLRPVLLLHSGTSWSVVDAAVRGVVPTPSACHCAPARHWSGWTHDARRSWHRSRDARHPHRRVLPAARNARVRPHRGGGRPLSADPPGQLPARRHHDRHPHALRHDPEAAEHANVTFEVDEIDRADRSGWSVLIRASAEEVGEEHRADLVARTLQTGLEPWAPGDKGHLDAVDRARDHRPADRARRAAGAGPPRLPLSTAPAPPHTRRPSPAGAAGAAAPRPPAPSTTTPPAAPAARPAGPATSPAARPRRSRNQRSEAHRQAMAGVRQFSQVTPT